MTRLESIPNAWTFLRFLWLCHKMDPNLEPSQLGYKEIGKCWCHRNYKYNISNNVELLFHCFPCWIIQLLSSCNFYYLLQPETFLTYFLIPSVRSSLRKSLNPFQARTKSATIVTEHNPMTIQSEANVTKAIWSITKNNVSEWVGNNISLATRKITVELPIPNARKQFIFHLLSFLGSDMWTTVSFAMSHCIGIVSQSWYACAYAFRALILCHPLRV